MEQAGFVDVVEKKFKLPLGSWMEDPKHKELGKWCLMFMDQGVEGMILYMATTILGVSYPFTTQDTAFLLLLLPTPLWGLTGNTETKISLSILAAWRAWEQC